MPPKVDFDAVLSDWIICPEETTGAVFLAGQVRGDRKGRFRDGAYIATSLVLSPQSEILDGRVVRTRNSRYLLTDRSTVDDALFRKLDEWLEKQDRPVHILDLIATGDTDLIAAYVLRVFRAAAAEAVRRDRLH